jgi:hypothetical protein
MESFVDGICNLIGFYLVLGSMLGAYIAPFVIAVVRDHHRLPWIGLLKTLPPAGPSPAGSPRWCGH